MPPDAVETLRQVNRLLRATLIRLRPERTPCSAIKPQDFSAILDQLQRATECLPELLSRSSTAPSQSSSPLKSGTAHEKEALEYRRNLEELQRFLPSLQVRLVAEKSRLETARAHVAAAAAWFESSQQMR